MERPLFLGFLASHNGSSMRYIQKSIESKKLDAQIKVVISNNSTSPALEFARDHNIRTEHISSKTDEDPDERISEVMLEENVDYIVLSGWMKELSDDLVSQFEGKIINSHPADTTKYGGKNMYGDNVHRAVLNSQDSQTYPTIHLVDYGIDTGKILAQGAVDVLSNDSPESLSDKVKPEEGRLLLGVLQNLASNEARSHL